MAGSFWLDESTSIRYTEGRAFSYGEGEDRINYTKAGATPSTFADLGFVQVTIADRPDDRFYFVSGPDGAGAYTATPRQLEDVTDAETGDVTKGLKSQYIAEQKQAAGTFLAQSDWYVTRKTEVDVDVPAAITTYRAAVRTVCDSRETAISAVTSVDQLKALLDAPAEIPDPNAPATMIDNPATHLDPWPEAPEV